MNVKKILMIVHKSASTEKELLTVLATVAMIDMDHNAVVRTLYIHVVMKLPVAG